MKTTKNKEHMPEFKKQRTPLEGEVSPKEAKLKATQAAMKYVGKFKDPK